MTRPCYAIIGGTLWGNRGAEAMVSATIAQVRARKPNARFLLMSYYPIQDRALCKDRDVTVVSAAPKTLLVRYFPLAMLSWLMLRIGLRLPLPKRLRALAGCNALLDVSGISFHDGRIAVLIYNVFCIWPALLLGVPVLHLSQARGPFNNLINRFLARRFLSACHHVYARGATTAKLMAELGLPKEKWSTAPDIAFAFTDGDSRTIEGEERTRIVVEKMHAARAAGQKIVIVSPSSVVERKTGKAGIAYVDLLRSAVRHLLSQGHAVVLMPNATRAGSRKGRNNDIVVIARILESLEGENNLHVVDFDLNTDRIRDIVRACDLLVTSRFHAMIAALCLAKPVLVVGWSHKYEEVLELFGCADDAIDFSMLDKGLVPALERALEGAQQTRARIASAYPDIRTRAAAQFDLIDVLP